MRFFCSFAGSLLCLLSLGATAKVVPEQAAKLGRELTPLGAEVAANAEGTIPPWNGGLRETPPCFKGAGTRYCDPYADKPLYVISNDNLLQYSGQLSAGQAELFRKNSGYQMRVYPTRRSFANPQFIYSATRENAEKAELSEDGETLLNAKAGVPFPLPKDGAEVIWNHRLRYQGNGQLRWNNQFAVSPDGGFSQVKFREEQQFIYNRDAAMPDDAEHALSFFLQVAMEPERLIGVALLIHEPLNPTERPRRSWQASPGLRKFRQAPSIGYDSLGTGADGLRTEDQRDTFNGGMERYKWKLITKKELIVPANSYALHSDAAPYASIIRPGHLNPELPRYELRRVWQVEATPNRSATHVYKKRVMYVDEDGWQIRVVDLYDGRDQLWRLQEAHTVLAYDRPYELPVCETVYDLQSGRYLVQSLNNQEPETVTTDFGDEDFEPGRALRRVPKS